MRYFQRVYSNPAADNYGKPFMAMRFEVTPDKVTSERWDVKSKSWVHDPAVMGQVTGIESDLDFEEIQETDLQKLLEALNGKINSNE